MTQIERYTVPLKWKDQYCQNDYNTQGNLQIQWNLYQITNSIFYKTRTKIFLICMEIQKIPKSNTRLRKKEQSWRTHAPWLYTILLYKTTIFKIVWYWHKNRNIDQWNSIKSLEINSSTQSQLIYNKEARIYNGEKIRLFKKWYSANWTAACKRNKLEHFLTPYTNIMD